MDDDIHRAFLWISKWHFQVQVSAGLLPYRLLFDS